MCVPRSIWLPMLLRSRLTLPSRLGFDKQLFKIFKFVFDGPLLFFKFIFDGQLLSIKFIFDCPLLFAAFFW